MLFINQIRLLGRKLYPTGRAFKMPSDSWFYQLNEAFVLSEHQAFTDAISIRDSLLPDNANFTAADADDWYRRLGLPLQSGVTLADKKLAIARKYQHPGNIPARQHYLYVQGQLQAAGFNVFVFENRFPDGMGGYNTQSPVTLAGGGGSGTQHGNGVQHGGAIQHGLTWPDIVANHIDLARDINFNVGGNLRSTFFIGGNPVGTYATIPAARRTEFRQLILKLKPTQTVALNFIVYV